MKRLGWVLFLFFIPYAHADVQVLTLSKNKAEYTLKDGKTKLSFRKVFTLGFNSEERYEATSRMYTAIYGLPYVSVGDQWLEIVNATKIYQNGYSFILKKQDCKIGYVDRGDYQEPVLKSCKISVETQKEAAPMMAAGRFKSIPFHLRDLHQSINTVSDDRFFLTLRVSIIWPRTKDLNNPNSRPNAMSAALSVITPFGVQNIEYDMFKDSPIMTVAKMLSTGPITLAFIPEDVGYAGDAGYQGYQTDNDLNYDRFNALVLVHQNENQYPVAIEYYY